MAKPVDVVEGTESEHLTTNKSQELKKLVATFSNELTETVSAFTGQRYEFSSSVQST
ncbi:MAG: hypothetical protein SOW59_04025 [Corynebacterium sp.]|nr:hypothetical protein [Corynebacterium sp.]